MSRNKTVAAAEYFERSKKLQLIAGNTTLRIANQIYVRQEYPLNRTFRHVAVEQFSTGIERIDFCNSKESARIINDFVEEKTNKKILNMITPDSIKCKTGRLVLINAIYFKGDWLHKFDKSLTAPRVFYPNEIDAFYVDFMNIGESFNVLDLDELDARALKLKYARSELSLVIVLPNKYTGLAALESRLLNYDLMKAFKRFGNRLRDVIVRIPMFKVEYEIELNKILKNVSVINIFRHFFPSSN